MGKYKYKNKKMWIDADEERKKSKVVEITNEQGEKLIIPSAGMFFSLSTGSESLDTLNEHMEIKAYREFREVLKKKPGKYIKLIKEHPKQREENLKVMDVMVLYQYVADLTYMNAWVEDVSDEGIAGAIGNDYKTDRDKHEMKAIKMVYEDLK